MFKVCEWHSSLKLEVIHFSLPCSFSCSLQLRHAQITRTEMSSSRRTPPPDIMPTIIQKSKPKSVGRLFGTSPVTQQLTSVSCVLMRNVQNIYLILFLFLLMDKSCELSAENHSSGHLNFLFFFTNIVKRIRCKWVLDTSLL